MVFWVLLNMFWACFPKLPEPTDDSVEPDTTVSETSDTTGEPVDATSGDSESNPCTHLDGPCARGVFSLELSRCVSVAIDDDLPCDDDNLCTFNGICRSGRCESEVRTCAASGHCESDGLCDPATGSCRPVAVVDGTPCLGTDACGATFACQSGTCVVTEPARDENDWIVAVPYEISVAGVQVGQGSMSADVLGLTQADTSIGSGSTIPSNAFVWLGADVDGLVSKVTIPRRRSDLLLPRNMRPHRDESGAVAGFVSLATSATMATIEWYGPERVLRGLEADETLTLASSTSSLAFPVVSESNSLGFAYAFLATGCVSTSVFDARLEPPLHEASVCANNEERRGIYLVFVDLRTLAFSEAVLPMRWQAAVLGPNAQGALPVPRQVAVAVDGTIALAVDFQGELVRGDGSILLSTRDGEAASTATDAAILIYAATGEMLDVFRIGGSRSETVSQLVWAVDRSLIVTGVTESEDIQVMRGSAQLGDIPMSSRSGVHAGLFLARFTASGEAAWLHRMEAAEPSRPLPRVMGLAYQPDRGTRVLVRTASRQRLHPELEGPALPALHLGFHTLHFDSNDRLEAAMTVHETLDGETWYDAERPLADAAGIASQSPADVVAIKGLWSGINGYRLLGDHFEFMTNQNAPTWVLYFNSNDRMRCSHGWVSSP
jgi:hypothetical protein